MRTAADIVQTKELLDRAAARVALAISSNPAYADNPINDLRARGFARYVKDASVLSTGDTAVAEAGLAASFLGAVDRESIVGQLDGAGRMPLGGVARIQVGSVSAGVTAEGAEKDIAQIEFTLDASAPSKVPATIVVTEDTLRILGRAMEAFLTRQLVIATAAATDVYLVGAFTPGSPAASSDPATLLMSISGGAPRRPALVGGFDSFLSLPTGTLRDLRDDHDVAIIRTPAAAGLLIAVDMAGLLIGDGTLNVDIARHASIRLDTGSPGAELISLWQNNMVAIRAERYMRVVVRPDAVAWASMGSPA